MNRYASMLLIAALTCIAPGVRADDTPAPPAQATQGPGVPLLVLMVEGAAGLNAAMASADPHAYGGLLALMAPIACGDGMEKGEPVPWAAFTVVEAMAFYDMTAYGSDYDRGKVFHDNFVAWNALFVVGGAVAYFTQDTPAEKVAQHLSLVPLPRHDGMMLSYRWTF